MADGGQSFLATFIGRVVLLGRRSMIRSYQGEERGEGDFTNEFSSILNTVNLKIFSNLGGIYTCI